MGALLGSVLGRLAPYLRGAGSAPTPGAAVSPGVGIPQPSVNYGVPQPSANYGIPQPSAANPNIASMFGPLLRGSGMTPGGVPNLAGIPGAPGYPGGGGINSAIASGGINPAIAANANLRGIASRYAPVLSGMYGGAAAPQGMSWVTGWDGQKHLLPAGSMS